MPHPHHVYCSIVSIAKTGRQHKCSSVDKWIKKMSYIYIFSHEKGEHSAIWKNMGGPQEYYAKTNQTKKDKYGTTI